VRKLSFGYCAKWEARARGREMWWMWWMWRFQYMRLRGGERLWR
jgi:hypothetical protein